MSGSSPSSLPIPPNERPATRLAEQSATYLSDTELLSLILARNLPVARSLETARSLLNKAGGIRRLSRMSCTELAETDGLGRASACTVQAALALASRLISPDAEHSPPKLETPSAVADLMRGQFLRREREEFHALLVDTKHRLIRDELVTVGLLDHVILGSPTASRPRDYLSFREENLL